MASLMDQYILFHTHTQLTGTVSHVLGKATFDSSFQEEREQIVESAQSGGGYIMAGLMGFTGGVFSGLTSMVTQPYKGAQEAGIGVRDCGSAKCTCIWYRITGLP